MQEHNKKRGRLNQGKKITIYALRKQRINMRAIEKY